MISARQELEIAGKQAKLRLHTGELEFYFRTADERDPRLNLVRAQIKDGKRELEVVSTNIAGQQKYKDQDISLLKWDAARGLYRFTLDQRSRSRRIRRHRDDTVRGAEYLRMDVWRRWERQ